MTVGITSSALPVVDDLYREIILDHYRRPRHSGEASAATGRVEAQNPLCGDEVCLSWRREGDVLAEVAFEGRGCSICMASSSMLCDNLTGCTVNDAVATARRFRAMLLEHGPADELGDLEALAGVAAYPVRIKCAVLSWNALLQELDPLFATMTGDHI